MTDEDNDTGCGDPNCANCKEDAWEEGLHKTFDQVLDATEALVAKGEHPVGVCTFLIGNKGTLIIETGGVGPDSMSDLLLSECALQVADYLNDRAEKTPGHAELLAKISKTE